MINWLLYLPISVQLALATLVVMVWYAPRMNSSDRWVAVTMLTYVVSDVCSSVLAFRHENNLWLYNIAVIPQFVITILTLTVPMKNLRVKQVMLTGLMVLTALHIFNLALGQGLHTFATFTYLPLTVWMATAAYYFLRERLDAIDDVPFTHWIVWFAMGVMIDNAGSLPILSVLGWSDFIHLKIADQLYSIVTWLYAGWYAVILTGLLWTKTLHRLRFSSR